MWARPQSDSPPVRSRPWSWTTFRCTARCRWLRSLPRTPRDEAPGRDRLTNYKTCSTLYKYEIWNGHINSSRPTMQNMSTIDSVLSHLHSEDVAVEVDGLSAVANLEHPMQGASGQVQSHLLCVFSPASATTDKTCTWWSQNYKWNRCQCNIYLVL